MVAHVLLLTIVPTSLNAVVIIIINMCYIYLKNLLFFLSTLILLSLWSYLKKYFVIARLKAVFDTQVAGIFMIYLHNKPCISRRYKY